MRGSVNFVANFVPRLFKFSRFAAITVATGLVYGDSGEFFGGKVAPAFSMVLKVAVGSVDTLDLRVGAPLDLAVL